MHMYRLPAALFIWALCHIGSVNGYVRPRDDTPTGVDSAPPAIVTPGFEFNTIAEMTTCKPALITWGYSPVTVDDPLELTLYITNNGVPQPPAPSGTSTGTFATSTNVGRAMNRRDAILGQEIITINPALRIYSWPSVNVTGGWYALVATMNLPGFLQTSTFFYVQNGSDVSCFASQPASSSSTPSNPSSTGSPTSTGVAETSGVTLPVSSSSGSSKVNRGAIAGGVIGGLAVIAAAIAAYFYLRYASASSASKSNRAQRNWAGLGSTDSKAKAYPPASRSAGVSSSGRHHSQSDSIGPMLSSRDSNVYVIGNVGIDSRPSRINDALEEQDEVNSYFSPSQEKISSTSAGRSPFSDSNHGHADAVPLDYIPSTAAAAAVTRNSSTSTSSYMNNFSRPRSDPSSPYGSPTAAEGPFSDSAQPNTSSSSIAGFESSSYPPTPSPAFPSGTSQAISERRGSGGESVAVGPPTRRTPRKPVPQYNPTDPALVSPPPPMPSPLPTVQDSDSSSSREGSIRGAFGDGRPVHYLIPDMPPPQRD